MQTIFDVTNLIGLSAGVSSMAISGYLLALWARQKTRLKTDLPLLFGIAFMVLGFNVVIMSLQGAGVIPDTMDAFRVRSIVIAGTVLPLLVMLLHIWLPRVRRFFPHVVTVVSIYWVVVSLVGPTREIVMMLNIPLMLTMMLATLLTFIVTWRTNRLTEIRSDLMILSSILLMVSQVSKVALMSVGMIFVSDLFMTAGVFFAVFGIANPWSISGYEEPKKQNTPPATQE